jgi:deazaflavin-dependent oxidoreductase (nitroreductase family)
MAAGPATRLLRRLGHKSWFGAVGRRFVPLDRALQRLTRGKIDVLGRGALPTLLLTTVGAKSGLPRTVPLLYAVDGDGWVVTASNWGQQHHPAWSGNLLANPEATVEVGGRAVPVRAELGEGELRDRLWTKVTQVWPAYDTYAERSGRTIRVFRLSRT